MSSLAFAAGLDGSLIPPLAQDAQGRLVQMECASAPADYDSGLSIFAPWIYCWLEPQPWLQGLPTDLSGGFIGLYSRVQGGKYCPVGVNGFVWHITHQGALVRGIPWSGANADAVAPFTDPRDGYDMTTANSTNISIQPSSAFVSDITSLSRADFTAKYQPANLNFATYSKDLGAFVLDPGRLWDLEDAGVLASGAVCEITPVSAAPWGIYRLDFTGVLTDDGLPRCAWTPAASNTGGAQARRPAAV